MKRLHLLTLLLSLSALVLLTESCEKEESCPTVECNTGTLNEETCNCDCPTGFSGTNCETEDLCVTQNVECQNGGTCVDGTCDCPDGYTGTNCENFDPNVQALLDGGQNPKALFDGGISLDSLYGKRYEGGIIFYLNTDDCTGMVAATEDQSTGAEWGCFDTDIMGLDNVPWNGGVPEGSGAEIGNGAANTTAILMECTAAEIAAKLCRDLGEEWFLPSIKELNLMYTNLHAKGSGGFAGDFYWSSTEFDNNDAWALLFDGGVDLNGNKNTSAHVRAVRAF